MKHYSGFEYLCIDVANAFGLDKELFENRILWVKLNINNLEAKADEAESKPLYMKAVQALRKTQMQMPSGHMVGLDSCNSGMQIMSVLTGCVVGATNTGLVNPNERSDAYSKLTQIMSRILGATSTVNRSDAKQALMSHYYGSRAEPETLFGEDNPDLAAFYRAAKELAPGASELLQELLDSWQPYALKHEWQLPDGFNARVKVMQGMTTRIEVDELEHASFTYEYYENIGVKKGLSNVANVVHSMDAYILRGMHRRCNYDRGVVLKAHEAIKNALSLGHLQAMVTCSTERIAYYIKQYKRSGMADIVILPYIKSVSDAGCLDVKHLKALNSIIESMLMHKPFPLVTVHDEFKAHPNNLNHVRQHYINIFAELAECNVLEDLLNQIHGISGGKYKKLSNNLGNLIRNSEYGLC